MVVALLMKPTGMVDLRPSLAGRPPPAIPTGLLDLVPCARHRMREVRKAARDVHDDALDTLICDHTDECLRRVDPF